MLHYREYPIRTASIFLLYALPLAYEMYIITHILSGSLFSLTQLEHEGLLGYGALAAVFTLPLIGVITDRVKRLDALLILVSIIPPLIGIFSLFIDFQIDVNVIQLAIVISAFSGIASLLVLWILRIGQSIVVRYRGRTTAAFMFTAIACLTFYSLVDQGVINLIDFDGFFISSLLAIFGPVASIVLRCWKEPRVTLSVSGNVVRYFIPTVFIMAAYLLWYNVTNITLQDYFISDSSYESLSQFLGLGIFEIVILIAGVLISGFMADYRGRKTTFSFALLLIGLLTIFGSAFYNGYFLNPSLTILLIALLSAERFIEGFLLGIGLLLIWSELGSARTKGLRLSLIMFFFLGYMTLFWAVNLGSTVFGIEFHFPSVLLAVGGQFAILCSLIALYLIGPLPTILGRELEVEELDLNFDEKQVKKTVDAFVGSDDFDSIKSQIDIIDAGTEISDSEMSEILGGEFKEILPLRSVPGIGDALEKKLRAAGYESAAQLAGEVPQRLSKRVDGISINYAEKLIKDARKLTKKKIKTNTK